MRYILLIHINSGAASLSKAELEVVLQGHERFEAELQAAGKGKMVHHARLRPAEEATRVRLKAGQQLVTDGPFMECNEVLGGFYVIECDTMDEAIDWAKRIPLREDRSVEVRPIWPK